MTNSRRGVKAHGQERKEKGLVHPRTRGAAITAVSYTAALMGALIEFTKRQDMTDQRSPEEWASAVRVWLGRRQMEYRT